MISTKDKASAHVCGPLFAMTKAPMRLLVSGLILLTAGIAAADPGTLPDGSQITFNRLFLHEGNSETRVQPAKDPDSLWAYFNLAHCVCSQNGAAMKDPYYEGTFAYEILNPSPGTPLNRPAEIWVGTNCNDNVQ